MSSPGTAEAFGQDVVDVAARSLRAPLALLLAAGEERPLASFGLADDLARQAVALARELGPVHTAGDLAEWPGVRDHPLVAGGPRLRASWAALVHDASGAAVGTLAVLDVQPRTPTPAEEQTLQALARMAAGAFALRRPAAPALVHHAGVPFFQTDAAGRLTYVNEAWTGVTGRTIEESLGCPLWFFVGLEDAHGLQLDLGHLRGAPGRTLCRTLRVPSATGDARWISVHAHGLSGGGVGGVLLDVTAQREAEATLELSESRFRAVFEEAAVGIALLLPSGRLLTTNPALDRMLGYRSRELRGRRLQTLTSPMGHHAHDEALSALRPPAAAPSTFDACYQRKDASLLEARLTLTPVRDDAEEPLFLVATFEDLTDRQRTERELLQAKESAETIARFKSALLDNISHEIRTPLTSILGYASVLAEEAPPPLCDFVDMIQHDGQRLLDTLNAVLDLARCEAGDLPAERERLDVNAEVRETLKLTMEAARERNLYLTALLPPEPVYVVGDRGFMQRALLNLIGNAIKFTDEGGVTVRVEAGAEAVRVSVIDTGVGITPAFRPHLFEAFKQESSGLRRRYAGAGLGLAITRHLVEGMGGTLAVESTLHAGSTFTVSLPLGTAGVEAP